MSLKLTYSVISFILVPYVLTFTPPTKEEQIRRMSKLNEDVEPFRKNLTECAHQVKATATDVEQFLKRIPQSSFEGKCFVACILKRNSIIVRNRIHKKNLIEVNRAVYGEDDEVMTRLQKAIDECEKVVTEIFEICEYASVFNDCMHMKLEHILDKVLMERRMEAMNQVNDAYADEGFDVEDDETMRMIRDEL